MDQLQVLIITNNDEKDIIFPTIDSEKFPKSYDWKIQKPSEFNISNLRYFSLGIIDENIFLIYFNTNYEKYNRII